MNIMNSNAVVSQPAALIDKDWWRGAVIYQIYPRSFQDSTGDGVGDLPGIVSRLPYVASLGVDAIWISPFFKSPMKDFGYDVSDYRDIDPMFGTLTDFDELITTAHELNLKVLIDQVLSHTSDQHPWFKESRQSRDNAKADWYVWADSKPDGTPPNNWLSIFGGTAWQWDASREQYYLHNFLSSQPDLNFHNTAVQNALLDDCRFWLDRGVDGFRLDTINFYYADKHLRDNPPLSIDERNGTIAPRVNPYNYQKHLYSKNQPENIDFIKRFRALLDEFPAATSVGEVGDAQSGLELMGEYTKGSDRIHMCYSFEFLSTELLDATRLKEIFTRLEAANQDGWACWALTNHDIKRHTTRWSLDDQSRRLYALLMMCLRGSVSLYQGEELGLPEAGVDFEDLQDPYGIEFWPKYKGRDGCRTPMVWDSNKPNGGFTQGKPWLPVDKSHTALSVDLQQQQNDSLLQYYRKCIEFRKEHQALVKGQQSSLNVDGDVVSFTRTLDGEELVCMFNIGSQEVDVTFPKGEWGLLGKDLSACLEQQGNEARLNAHQALIAKKL